MAVGLPGRAVRSRVAAAAMCAAVLGTLIAVVGPPAVAPAAVEPVPNPEVEDSCGIESTLVLDASGSISSAGAVEDVRDAGTAFLEALADTSSTARIIDFGTVARVTAPTTQVTSESVAPGGVHAEAMDEYYNPKPPLQPGVSGHRYRGGPVGSTSSYSDGSDPQYTNWDQSLDVAGDEPSELVVFVTDGEPSAVDSDQPGDPFYAAGQDPPNVRYQTDGSSEARELTLDRAVEEANAAKDEGARVLAIGVGSAFGSSEAVDRLEAVSGPMVVSDPDDIVDLNSVDVALVEDFERLTEVLRRVVTQLCSPSLTIRKLAQSPESPAYEPAPGWTTTVTPDVATPESPPYEWILPTPGAPVGAQSAVTDPNGFAAFQWEPNPPTSSSAATVAEEPQEDFTPNDYSCQSKQPDGSVVETSGALDPDEPTFTLDVGPESIVTCTLRNDFDYQPGIHIEKANAPTLIRGDTGGTVVTSTYEVTNTGNTPLTVADPTDDRCSPVTFQSGDTDDDDLLDLDETWVYACDRLLQSGLSSSGVSIENVVDVSGTDPDGNQVSDQAEASVEVITPDIVIEKSVDQPTVVAGTVVTYTYEVHTNGNTPLSPVEVVDDTCSPVDYVSGDDGDDALEPGETWVYECSATIDEKTINTATATGTPAIGPDVTDEDQAVVVVVDPDLQLTKVVSQRLVLPGSEVTYTFEVSNPGAVTLVPPAPTTRADFVADDHCTPAYESGDVGDDSRLEPGETWVYGCSATIDAVTLNTGTVVAEVEGLGTELTRTARELVVPLPPLVRIDKFPSASMVYDGDEVTYTYEVTNPGLVPLSDVEVADDTCSPATYVSGDDGDDVLQSGELWTYECTATLVKSGSSPDAPEVVTNVATVEGTPVLGAQTGEPITDEAEAEVAVIQPSLEIVKVADPTEVRVGREVTYTVTITNTGDTPLVYVAQADTRCNPLVYQSGDVGDDGIAQVGEAWVYTCTEEEVFTDRTNVAGVVGIDVLGGLLSDLDPAEVTVYDPRIALEKTVSDPFVPQGEVVTYTFEVSNAGDDPITGVITIDTDCTPVVYQSGDTGGDGVLGLDEVWVYTCDAPVSEAYVNVAGVSGDDHVGRPVFAVGAVAVQPYVPGIAVVKSATPTELTGEGEVTYTYDVTNTGDVPLAEVEAGIADDTCSPVTYVSGDDDGNGLLTGDGDIFETGNPETWRFTCTTTVSEDTVNTVVVSGTPAAPTSGSWEALGPQVTAADEATVIVVQPAPPDPDGGSDADGDAAPAGSTGTLPVTGADLGWLLMAGLALIGSGAALLTHRRVAGRAPRSRRRS